MHVIVLALIQGFTEFLPISSSAHLILPSQLLGWPDQGLAFDVSVHLGTLFAVVLYYRTDLRLLGLGLTTRNAEYAPFRRLGWLVLIATLPAAAVGFCFKAFIEDYSRSALVIAITTLVFGLLLWYADRKASQTRHVRELRLTDALLIGVAQAIALIPGTSRSGITMTAGLLLGLDRKSAAHFSFYLSIPIISLAAAYNMMKLSLSDTVVDWPSIALGTGVSFFAALTCIYVFMNVIERMGLWPFVVYRLLLGVGLLGFLAWQ